MSNTFITDAGRSASSHPNEKLDCTIRAFATALNISYDDAHAVLKASGRKDRHRFKSCGAYTKHIGKSCKRSGSVGRFLRDNPLGRFIVQVRGHVFAVIDGIPHDKIQVSERWHVSGAWRVTQLSLGPNQT